MSADNGKDAENIISKELVCQLYPSAVIMQHSRSMGKNIGLLAISEYSEEIAWDRAFEKVSQDVISRMEQ